MAEGSLFDFVFLVSNEKTQAAKEDAYAYDLSKTSEGYLAVFDGCGGLGSRKYRNAKMHTGAYIASLSASEGLFDWYEKKTEPVSAAALKKMFVEKLEKRNSVVDDGSGMLFGSMIRTLPTTAVVATVEKDASALAKGCFYWAGDSRGYILDEQGLHQYTKDDIQGGEDAFDNLYNDSPLSNLLQLSEDFRINKTPYAVTKPSVIMAATDGVFGYLPSPMHFEMMLLDALDKAETIAEWESAVLSVINEVSGDDATLVMTGVGFHQSFKQIKDCFFRRKAALKEMLAGTSHSDVEGLKHIWLSKYRAGYEKYSK